MNPCRYHLFKTLEMIAPDARNAATWVMDAETWEHITADKTLALDWDARITYSPTGSRMDRRLLGLQVKLSPGALIPQITVTLSCHPER